MSEQTSRIDILGPIENRFDEILTPEALDFLTRLHDQFAGRRQERLHARMTRAKSIENGQNLDFLVETAAVRDEPTWRVAGPGPGLEDRRVEITGPTDRKMAINALNSGAKVWLADLEDATSPTWENIIGGQLNLSDAIRRQIDFTADNGKEYQLAEDTPTIVMRPRGWHLVEKHLRYSDRAGIASSASASLVDFGLYFFHNAKELIARGSGPYFYLPKIENHLEARLWNDIFTFSENALGHPARHDPRDGADRDDHRRLRDGRDPLRAARPLRRPQRRPLGLHLLRSSRTSAAARRASCCRTVREDHDDGAPSCAHTPSCSSQTCHKRGAHAIGGMSAFIPNRNDPAVTARALDAVSRGQAAGGRRTASTGPGWRIRT